MECCTASDVLWWVVKLLINHRSGVSEPSQIGRVVGPIVSTFINHWPFTRPVVQQKELALRD